MASSALPGLLNMPVGADVFFLQGAGFHLLGEDGDVVPAAEVVIEHDHPPARDHPAAGG